MSRETSMLRRKIKLLISTQVRQNDDSMRWQSITLNCDSERWQEDDGVSFPPLHYHANQFQWPNNGVKREKENNYICDSQLVIFNISLLFEMENVSLTPAMRANTNESTAAQPFSNLSILNEILHSFHQPVFCAPKTRIRYLMPATQHKLENYIQEINDTTNHYVHGQCERKQRV